jgi:proteasome alpha subunit
MSLAQAFAAALAALAPPANGERSGELVASQLEVAILDRSREHRAFRRIRAAALEDLISQSRSAATPGDGDSATSAEPSTGPDPSTTDRGSGAS